MTAQGTEAWSGAVSHAGERKDAERRSFPWFCKRERRRGEKRRLSLSVERPRPRGKRFCFSLFILRKGALPPLVFLLFSARLAACRQVSLSLRLAAYRQGALFSARRVALAVRGKCRLILFPPFLPAARGKTPFFSAFPPQLQSGTERSDQNSKAARKKRPKQQGRAEKQTNFAAVRRTGLSARDVRPSFSYIKTSRPREANGPVLPCPPKNFAAKSKIRFRQKPKQAAKGPYCSLYKKTATTACGKAPFSPLARAEKDSSAFFARPQRDLRGVRRAFCLSCALRYGIMAV